MRPSVSVVIPTYNGVRFIREALDSVFAQTELPLEIIVVDDASTDGTPELAESLATSSPIPLHVVRLAANSGGPARPINVGVAKASAPLIAVLDQDDVYTPGNLERLATALTNAPSATVAFCWAAKLGRSDGQPLQGQDMRERLAAAGTCGKDCIEIAGDVMLNELASFTNFVQGYPGFMFRRDLWERKGGVDESLRVASDLELLGWLFQQGSAALAPNVGYWRRMHDANVTNNAPQMHLESAVVIVRLFESAKCLRDNAIAVEQVRQTLRGMAYWFRKAHLYREARQLSQLCARLGGSALATWTDITKLHLERTLSWLLKRRPILSAYTGEPKESIPARETPAVA